MMGYFKQQIIAFVICLVVLSSCDKQSDLDMNIILKEPTNGYKRAVSGAGLDKQENIACTFEAEARLKVLAISYGKDAMFYKVKCDSNKHAFILGDASVVVEDLSGKE